jgi:hypothetical protein
MNPSFLLAIGITVLFGAFKFAEMRYDEDLPLKTVVRDALVVFLSSLGASYIFFAFQSTIVDFFNVVTEAKVINAAATQVFTDIPPF